MEVVVANNNEELPAIICPERVDPKMLSGNGREWLESRQELFAGKLETERNASNMGGLALANWHLGILDSAESL